LLASLEEPYRARIEEVQIFALCGTLAHREADVAVHGVAAGNPQRLEEHNLRIIEDAAGCRQGLAEIDAAGGPGADRSVAVGLRIDLQIVAASRIADVTAAGEQVDRIADHVGGVVALAAIRRSAVGGARIDDRAGLRRQGDVALGVDGVDLEITDRFVLYRGYRGVQQIVSFGAGKHFGDEDALSGDIRRDVERIEDAKRRARAVQDVLIDLEEVVGRADAAEARLIRIQNARSDTAIAGSHRDIDASNVSVMSGADAIVKGINDHPGRM